MGNCDMLPLPLGRSVFSSLRQAKFIYVDKTEMICRLAKDGARFFLARPRRFGKSLLLSTFESLFRYGLRDFKGLAIEKLWKDKTYKVLHLDFSMTLDFQSIEEFLELFDRMLDRSARNSGLEIPQRSTDPVDRLASFISMQDSNTLVLLIDEYDTPLTANLDNPVLFSQVRRYLTLLYSSIKAYEGCLRFFFMTGITKISNTGIFSAFNNLQDISLRSAYGTLLGYTDEEIRRFFPQHVKRAARELRTDPEDILRQLKETYDGFSFDERAATHVYSPWSILNFLNCPEQGFKNYWYASSGQPTVLMKYLENHALENPVSFDQPIVMSVEDLDASRQYDEISVESLLTQCGYFTIRERLDGGFLLLGYPNREVAMSMARLYANRLIQKGSLLESGVFSLARTMAHAPADAVIDHFNRALNAIVYQRYPITDEASCRAYLQVLMIGASLLPMSTRNKVCSKHHNF